MQWICLFFICRERRKHLARVPLQGSLVTYSLGTAETTPFQKALPSLTTHDLIKKDLPRCTILCMRVGTSRDLPVCTNLNMQGGSSLLCIIQRVPGNRAQVGNGRTTILTTTSSSPMRSPATTREDACPSLLVASTTSTWAPSAAHGLP